MHGMAVSSDYNSCYCSQDETKCIWSAPPRRIADVIKQMAADGLSVIGLNIVNVAATAIWKERGLTRLPK